MGHICHHTLGNQGNSKDIIASGPIKGVSANNYFGEGYYFWDDNLKHAMWWGKKQYQNKYYIFEANVVFDLNKMFDVTDRSCISFLKDVVDEFLEGDIDLSGYFLGPILTLLFEEEIKTKKQLFPYLYAKGIDLNNDYSSRMNYSPKTKSYFLLNPTTFFCIFNVENIHLQTFKLIIEY